MNITITRRDAGVEHSVQIDCVDQAAGSVLQLQPLVPAPAALEWSDTLCKGKRVSFADAEKAIAALGPEWRFPERHELESILDLSRHDPAIDTERFPDTKSGAYWTSTTYAPDPSCAWFVDFLYGLVGAFPRDDYYAFVRACRAVPAGQ